MSQQEVFYRTQQSQEIADILALTIVARNCGQSRQKPSITDSLGRKHKLVDWSIPCDLTQMNPVKIPAVGLD